MSKDHIVCSIIVVLALLLVSTACASSAPTVATTMPTIPPATDTPLPTSTATVRPTPTRTPQPTNTPDVTVTAIYDNLFSKVQMFNDEGLIPSTEGKYEILDSFNESVAKIGWLRFWNLDLEAENFVLNANVNWRTAIDTSDKSGCGVIFSLKEEGDNHEYYGVVLDKSRIYFTISKGGHYHELGKTRGTGRLNFGNPAEAELTMLVYDNSAFVYVDDNFIGEYTLSQDKELRGNFGYGVISGTNKDYGTRCIISNSRVWLLEPQ